MNDERTITIGLDGGGSRTRFAIRTTAAAVTYVELRGSLKYTDIGIEASAARLASAIEEHSSRSQWDVLKVAISLSGASNEEINSKYKALLAQYFNDRAIRIYIESDSSFTLRAAYPNGESGYLIIAGTGSVGLARDVQGNIFRAGGWGRLLGDEGSGYWLGVEALKYYFRAIDGADEKGELFMGIEAQVRTYADTFASLRSLLYSNELNPSVFSPMLFHHYQDHTAQNILHHGAAHLAGLVKTLRNRIRSEVNPTLTLHGSIAAQPIYSEMIALELDHAFDLRVITERDVVDFVLQTAENL